MTTYKELCEQAIEEIAEHMRTIGEGTSRGVRYPTAKIRFGEALERAHAVSTMVTNPEREVLIFFTSLGVKFATARALASNIATARAA